MRRIGLLSCSVLALGFCALSAQASHIRRGPTSPKAHAKSQGHGGKRGTKATSSSRPRAIDDARASEIQTALVKAGYLQSASGHWDSESADAMRKLQGDNGWQTKLIPDSRALIKLGLGPGAGASGETATNLVGATE